jgi:hypothetical protein
MKILESLKEFIRSKHIQLALVTGVSLIVLTFVSKRVLSAPMENIYISIPGLIMVAAEGVLGLKKKAWYTNQYLWIISAVLATSLIVVLHLK